MIEFSLVFCSVMAVPATVIYFTCYDQLHSLLRVRMGDYADNAPPLAGALARGEQDIGYPAIKRIVQLQMMIKTLSFCLGGTSVFGLCT